MSSDSYTIQTGDLNTAAGKPINSNYKLGVSVGQTAPRFYTGTNYKVRAGFQYIHSIIPFTFSISSTLIDFGVLTATNPVTRKNVLFVSNGSAAGYSVLVYENHELLVPASGALIPDTSCDTGTCSQTSSAAWTSTLTYGFGYRCDNLSSIDCASGFSDANTYKQFANSAKDESPQAVMSSSNVGKEKESEITYKVNISGTQPAGFYTNVITFIATPTY
ncbi:MAG TPA: hypothetical protein VJC10_01305 [Patescibacteria group bacterium]|nr:hypothetical protein [Patescibacteria group bacterium]